MELKTKVMAEEGRQDFTIVREFEIPVDLLFQAYIEPEIVEQWMGTKVIKLENKKHGSWRFETTDPKGNIYPFHGVIHEYLPGKQIIRTFEMENSGFGVQLEFLQFSALTEDTSRLDIHTIFQSVEQRDRMLQRGMAKGMSMAHDRLQAFFNNKTAHYEQEK